MKNKYHITIQFFPDKNKWDLDLKINKDETYGWRHETFELVVIDFLKSIMEEKLRGVDLLEDVE